MGNASSNKIPISHLVPYFVLRDDVWICRFCTEEHKNPSRRWIFNHFVSDLGEIRCINMQRCPKCRDLILKSDLNSHLKHDCRFWDVHFMKCEACTAARSPLEAPHDPSGLICMQIFLEQRLSDLGIDSKNLDLTDLYGPQKGLKGFRSLHELVFLQKTQK